MLAQELIRRAVVLRMKLESAEQTGSGIFGDVRCFPGTRSVDNSLRREVPAVSFNTETPIALAYHRHVYRPEYRKTKRSLVNVKMMRHRSTCLDFLNITLHGSRERQTR